MAVPVAQLCQPVGTSEVSNDGDGAREYVNSRFPFGNVDTEVDVRGCLAQAFRPVAYLLVSGTWAH